MSEPAQPRFGPASMKHGCAQKGMSLSARAVQLGVSLSVVALGVTAVEGVGSWARTPATSKAAIATEM